MKIVGVLTVNETFLRVLCHFIKDREIRNIAHVFLNLTRHIKCSKDANNKNANSLVYCNFYENIIRQDVFYIHILFTVVN